MKFASIESVKKIRDTGMRKKDIAFWGSKQDENQWHCWMNIVIEYLEKRAKRQPKLKNSISVNLENSEA